MLQTITQTKQYPNILKEILKEIRLMRQELNLMLPQDDLKEYQRADKIKKSYANAIKKYPPLCK